MKIYVLDLKNKGRFIEFYVNISDTGRLPQKKIVPIGMTATQLKGGNCVLDGLQCIQLLGRSATQSPQQCKGVLDHPPPPPLPQPGQDSSLWYVHKESVQSRFKGLKLGGFNHLL